MDLNQERSFHFNSIAFTNSKGFRLQRSQNNPISTGGDEWCFVRPQPWHFADSRSGSCLLDRWIKRILSGEQVTWILSIVTAMKNDW